MGGTLSRWTARAMWLGATVAMLAPAHTTAQPASDEYRLKAAFVYRFPQFVGWPSEALREARTLDVCVLEPNPFGSDLEQLISGERLEGRPLRVRLLAAGHDVTGCHALFVGARSEGAASALKAVAGRPVLTIGETDQFLRDGGIIVLRLVDRRVRFEVQAANALKAGLRVSAQLLSLASAVHGGAK